MPGLAALLHNLREAEKIKLCERLVLQPDGVVGVVNFPFRAAVLLAVADGGTREPDVRRQQRLKADFGPVQHGRRGRLGGWCQRAKRRLQNWQRGFEGINQGAQFLRPFKTGVLIKHFKRGFLLRRPRAVNHHNEGRARAAKFRQQRAVEIVQNKFRTRRREVFGREFRVIFFNVHQDDAHRKTGGIAALGGVKFLDAAFNLHRRKLARSAPVGEKIQHEDLAREVSQLDACAGLPPGQFKVRRGFGVTGGGQRQQRGHQEREKFH